MKSRGVRTDFQRFNSKESWGGGNQGAGSALQSPQVSPSGHGKLRCRRPRDRPLHLADLNSTQGADLLPCRRRILRASDRAALPEHRQVVIRRRVYYDHGLSSSERIPNESYSKVTSPSMVGN